MITTTPAPTASVPTPGGGMAEVLFMTIANENRLHRALVRHNGSVRLYVQTIQGCLERIDLPSFDEGIDDLYTLETRTKYYHFASLGGGDCYILHHKTDVYSKFDRLDPNDFAFNFHSAFGVDKLFFGKSHKKVSRIEVSKLFALVGGYTVAQAAMSSGHVMPCDAKQLCLSVKGMISGVFKLNADGADTEPTVQISQHILTAGIAIATELEMMQRNNSDVILAKWSTYNKLALLLQSCLLTLIQEAFESTDL
jgi:hypothetical protein